MTGLALGNPAARELTVTEPTVTELTVMDPTAKASTEKLYDASAGGWVRDEPVLLSDYTARPVVFEWCAPLEGARVLDLG